MSPSASTADKHSPESPHLNYNRHYTNLFKEARKLAKYTAYDQSNDVVSYSTKYRFFSKKTTASRMAFLSRLSTLLANLNNKDDAIMTSMTAFYAKNFKGECLSTASCLKEITKKILTSTPPTKLPATFKLVMRSQGLYFSSTPTVQQNQDMVFPMKTALGEDEGERFASRLFLNLDYVLGCKPLPDADSEKREQIRRLLSAEEVRDVDDMIVKTVQSLPCLLVPRRSRPSLPSSQSSSNPPSARLSASRIRPSQWLLHPVGVMPTKAGIQKQARQSTAGARTVTAPPSARDKSSTIHRLSPVGLLHFGFLQKELEHGSLTARSVPDSSRPRIHSARSMTQPAPRNRLSSEPLPGAQGVPIGLATGPSSCEDACRGSC